MNTKTITLDLLAPIVPAPAWHPAIDAIRAELDAIGLDVATSYTLADAMREGAAHTSQKHGGWIESGASCALGASLLSATARGYVSKS